MHNPIFIAVEIILCILIILDIILRIIAEKEVN